MIRRSYLPAVLLLFVITVSFSAMAQDPEAGGPSQSQDLYFRSADVRGLGDGVYLGDTVLIDYAVGVDTSRGGSSSPAQITVAVLLGGEEIDRHEISGRGNYWGDPFEYVANQPGVLEFELVIDPDNLALEPTENNNREMLVVGVFDQPSPGPDQSDNVPTRNNEAQGSDLHFNGPFESLEEQLYDDEEIRFVADVSNRHSTRRSQATEVAFYFDGVEVERKAVPALNTWHASDDSHDENFFSYLGAEVGVHELKVVIDPDHTINDVNRANNEARTLINILPRENRDVVQGSDLYITGYFSPNTVAVGETAHYQLYPRNDAPSLEDDDQILVSVAKDGEEVAVHRFHSTGNRWIHGQDTFPFVPEEPGVFEFSYTIDSDNRYPERNEDNNTYTSTLTVLSRDEIPMEDRANLTFSWPDMFFQLPERVQVGTTLRNREVSIYNAGSQESGATSSVTEAALFVGDEEIYRQDLPPIPVSRRGRNNDGAVVSLFWDVPFNEIGTQEVRVVLDVDDRVPESGEINTLTRIVEVFDPNAPEGLDFYPVSFVGLEESYNPDEPVRVMVNVNQETPTGEHEFPEVVMYLDGEEVYRGIARSALSQDDYVHVYIASHTLENLESGEHTVRVVVDENDQFEEIDENNNEMTQQFTVLSRDRFPDFNFRSLRLNPNRNGFYFNENVRLDYDVYGVDSNSGVLAPESVEVTILLNDEEVARHEIHGRGTLWGEEFHYVADTPGDFEFEVVIDPDNHVVEADESNNRGIMRFGVSNIESPGEDHSRDIPGLYDESPGSDLHFDRAFERLEDEYYDDEEIRFVSDISNAHSEDWSEETEVAFYYDGEEIRRTNIPSLNYWRGNSNSSTERHFSILNPEVGVHELKVVIDPDNMIEDSNRLNNEARQLITVYPHEDRVPVEGSDLIVSGSFSPSRVIVGETVFYDLRPRNIGGFLNQDDQILVSVAQDGEEIATHRFYSSSRDIIDGQGRHSFVPEEAGEFEFSYTIDSDQRHPETDENNNTDTSILTVLTREEVPAADKADLAFLHPDSTLRLPERVSVGTVFYDREVTAKNYGSQESGATSSITEAALFIGDVEISRRHLPSIRVARQGQVYEGTTADLNWDIPLNEVGTFDIRVVLDVDDRVPESREGNNTLLRTVEVVDPASGVDIAGQDLIPVEFSGLEDSYLQGQSIHITLNVDQTTTSGERSFAGVVFYIDDEEILRETLSSAGSTNENLLHFTSDTIAENISPGEHVIRAVVDPDNYVLENNELNNEITHRITVIEVADAPDFGLTNVRFSPSRNGFYRNEPFHFDYTVTRHESPQGTPAPNQVDVAILLNGEEVARHELNGVGVNLWGQDLEYIAEEAGVHEFTVVVDPDNEHEELDETNNRQTLIAGILDQDYPGPSSRNNTPTRNNPAQGFDLHFDRSFLALEDEFYADEEIRFRSEVSNGHSEIWSPSAELAFYFDGEEIRRTQIPTLNNWDANSNSDYEAHFTYEGAAVGPHELKVVIDPDSLVDDSNRSNNEARTIIFVQPAEERETPTGVDLNISGYFPRNDVGVGETVFYELNPRNSGTSLNDGDQVLVSVEVSGEEVDEYRFHSNGRTYFDLQDRHSMVVDTPGEHEVRFIIDSDNRYSETDENNNVATTTLRVLEREDIPLSDRADLAFLHPDYTLQFPERVPVGTLSEDRQVSAVNDGNRESGADSSVTEAVLLINGEEIERRAIPQLRISRRGQAYEGTTSHMNFDFNFDEVGTYEIQVVLDVDDRVPESRESNNTLTRVVEVFDPEGPEEETSAEEVEEEESEEEEGEGKSRKKKKKRGFWTRLFFEDPPEELEPKAKKRVQEKLKLTKKQKVAEKAMKDSVPHEMIKAAAQQALEELMRAYEREDLSAFMELVSEEFISSDGKRYSDLRRSLITDFEEFSAIGLKLRSFSKVNIRDTNSWLVSMIVDWNRRVNVEVDGERKFWLFEGRTEFVFHVDVEIDPKLLEEGKAIDWARVKWVALLERLREDLFFGVTNIQGTLLITPGTSGRRSTLSGETVTTNQAAGETGKNTGFSNSSSAALLTNQTATLMSGTAFRQSIDFSSGTVITTSTPTTPTSGDFFLDNGTSADLTIIGAARITDVPGENAASFNAYNKDREPTMTTEGPTAGTVYLVKTTEGNYAKFIIDTFTQTGDNVITITYAYQPDGSENLASED